MRKAAISDIDQLVEWVWIILEDMELTLLQEANPNTLKKLMRQAMEDKNYRYSYQCALTSTREGKRAGVYFGYKGELEPIIDKAFNEKLALLGIVEPSQESGT